MTARNESDIRSWEEAGQIIARENASNDPVQAMLKELVAYCDGKEDDHIGYYNTTDNDMGRAAAYCDMMDWAKQRMAT